MNQKIEKILKILERKSGVFERNRESSKDEVSRRIDELAKLLKEIEDALLKGVEISFGENQFADAISTLQGDESPGSIAKAEEVSKMDVLEPIYPENEELESTREALQRLLNLVKPIPKNLCARTGPTGTVTLSWDRTTNASGYRAEMKGPWEKAFREIYRGRESSITTKRLVSGGDNGANEYQMRVCALYGEGGASGWSDVVTARPWCLVAPKGVSATSEASDAIRVTWDGVNAGSGGAARYQVEVQASGFSKTYNSDKPFLSEKEFEPMKEYRVRVRSVVGRDTSEWSSPSITVKTQSPKCLMGHDLVTYTTNEACTKHGYSEINCDICRRKFLRNYKGVLYGCRICNYDMCPECVKKFRSTTTMKCPKGHPLSLVPLSLRLCGKQYSEIECDLCRKDGINLISCSANYPLFHCQECDYDMCPECAAKHK